GAFRKLHCPIRNRPNPSLAAAAVSRTLEVAPPAPVAAPVAAPVPISLTPVCSKLVLGKTRALPLLFDSLRRCWCCSTQPRRPPLRNSTASASCRSFPQLWSSARLESLALSLHSFQSYP